MNLDEWWHDNHSSLEFQQLMMIFHTHVPLNSSHIIIVLFGEITNDRIVLTKSLFVLRIERFILWTALMGIYTEHDADISKEFSMSNKWVAARKGLEDFFATLRERTYYDIDSESKGK